jgi:predicted aspartyl protease
MRSAFAHSLVLCLILALNASTCHATERQTQNRQTATDRDSARETIELELQDYMGALTTVELKVGDETLPFFLDTGGGLTVITPGLANRLGLQTFGRVTGFRMDGERVDMARCQKTTFGVGALNVEMEPTVFDLMSLLPPGWPEAGGVVSLHTFENHVITLDLADSKLIVETEASERSRTGAMRLLNVRFSRQAGGASVDLMVEAVAKTGTLWLEVDTGNTGPVRLAPHALEQLGVAEESADVAWAGTVTLDISGLGSIEVAAVEADLICDGVLNVDTIRKMILTVDMPTCQAWALLR